MLTARENADNPDLTVAGDIAGDASDKQVTDDDLQLSPDETENDPLQVQEKDFEPETFSVKEDAEKKGDKPVIRLFSTTWCPHCIWIIETYDRVILEYVNEGKIIAYHWELDTGDNTLTPEKESEVPASERAILEEFNPRKSIPTYVFGEKYYRVGNGYERFKTPEELEMEEEEIRIVIENLIEEYGN